jgi:hypothetical protein
MERRFIHWGLRDKEGTENGASLSLSLSLSLSDDFFTGDSEGYGNAMEKPVSPTGGTWRRVCLPGTLRDSKRMLDKHSVSVYGSTVRGTFMAPLLKARSCQNSETGSETDFRP